MAEIEWNPEQLRAFARSLNHDKDGRLLKKRMQAQFDSITEDLRDRLRQGVSEIPGIGTYPRDAAETMKFTTKLVGGKNARVTIVGEGKTAKGKWREFGKFLEDGVLFHPMWGLWYNLKHPGPSRQEVPQGPQMIARVVSQGTGPLQDEIRAVLTQYLDQLTDIRKA